MKLKEKYVKEVIPAMMEKFSYCNKMSVSKIVKIVLNTGIGKLIAGKTSEEQKKIYEDVLRDISLVAGQRPVLTKAKKSISGFKIREGLPIGARVTLRKKKMEDFLERLIHITLPRTRDFRGIDSKSIDRGGNLTVAIKEHIVFPEILPEKVRNIFGFEITIVTGAKTREKGLELLRLMGLPIKSS